MQNNFPQHKTKILMTEFVTHDVRRFVVEKPGPTYTFVPGQATEVAIDESGWGDKKRPFTFTSLNEDEVLEFTIKGYPEHSGVTEKLHSLGPGAELLLGDVWGTINYKGPGTFIAGGAGITPFIAIFRDLVRQNDLEGNSLIFSNKTSRDVVLEKELREVFAPRSLHLILTEESSPLYEEAYIDRDYIESTVGGLSQNFYVCGPPKFVEDVQSYLLDLGASSDSVVFER
jgi:ferredoxin-NADP reductase